MISIFPEMARSPSDVVGLGYPIIDKWCTKAVLSATLNGAYTAEFTIPHKAKGVKRELLPGVKQVIKLIDMDGDEEYFRVRRFRHNLKETVITAEHISYDLIDNLIEDINNVDKDGQGIMDKISAGTQYKHPFRLTSDILKTANIRMVRMNPIQALIGTTDNTFVNRLGGELKRKQFTLAMDESIGTHRTDVIRSRRNLTGFEREINLEDYATRIMPRAKNGIELPEKYVDSPHIAPDHPVIKVIDYSDVEYDGEFKDLSDSDKNRVYNELRACAKADFAAGRDVPNASYEVDFITLRNTVEYADYRALENYNLGDTVSIYEADYDVEIEAKVISFEWDVLNKRYTSMKLGSFKNGIVRSNFNKTNSVDAKISQAQSTADIALLSADGKTTNFYGTGKPVNPKKGDTWFKKNGSEEEVWQYQEVDGVMMWVYVTGTRYANALKESIAHDFSEVTQQIAEQQQEHDRQVADILSKTQSVEALAKQAKTDAASAIARANQVKTEAIADARAQVATVSQALNTAKSELQTAIASADQKARDSQASATALRNDLNLQASKILEQARAQTDLTNRVTTVETLADGTRSTVAELSKTVNKATGDIASVTSRTKTVEDTLSQTRTQYEALTQTINAQTGQIDSINRKTADLQSGIDGVTERFENLKIGSRNYFKNSKSRKYYITNLATQDVRTYIDEEFWQNDTRFIKDYVRMSFDIAFNPALPSDFTTNVHFSASPWYNGGSITFKGGTTELQHFDLKFNLSGATSAYKTDNIFIRLTNSIPLDTAVRLENFNLYLSAVIEDYSQSDVDFESKIAEYKRTADQNYAGLQSTVSTLDGKVAQNKTEANQTATQLSNRLTSLETYKDGESARAQAYFEASKTETAKQLTAERTAIANNYVAKSIYDENVRGTTLKLNEVKSTADTAKQNLATYQNTVDQKLTELTSSTQTLDGKVNTASAKVDTVAGQIRTEIREVEGKIPTTVGGQNLIKNGGYPTNTQYWSGQMIVSQHNYYYNGQRKLFLLQTSGTAEITASTNRFEVKRNTNYTLSFYAFAGSNVRHSDVFFLGRKSNETDNFTSASKIIGSRRFSASKAEYVTVTFNSGNNDSGYIRFDNNGSTDGVNAVLFFGEVMLVEGTVARTFEPSLTELVTDITSAKTTITQTSQGVEQLSTSLSTTNNKVSTAETKISQLISDVSSKVSQTDYDTLTGRMSSAETLITQNATEISKRLTSTQVDKAITDKGYQTKSQVDNNITGRGYITNSALQPYALSTTVQNLVKETADSFSRTISAVKTKIPTEAGGTNLVRGSAELKKGNNGWTEGHWRNSGSGGTVEYNVTLPSSPVKGIVRGAKIVSTDNAQIGLCQNGIALEPGTYTMSAWVIGNRGLKVHVSSAFSQDGSNQFNSGSTFLTLERYGWTLISQTFTIDKRYNNLSLCYLMLDTPGTVYFSAPYIHKSSMAGDWSPAPEDLATVTALHSVKDTVDSHTRTIGAIGTAGSILDNVSKVTQTAAGLVAEVSGSNGLKTQVSTLAGSYAIKNLTKAGDVLGQINLNKDGSVKIDGKLVQITGKTYIQDGVITSAKIAGLDAGKITTGTLNAARIAVNSIDGSKLVFDQAFVNKMTANEALFKQLFAQNAFITSVQSTTMSADMIKGGLLISSNGATNFDLNNGNLLFNNNYGYIRRTANDKIFEITTLLTEKSDYSPEGLSSKFMIRKSDSSRQSGVSFNLYTTVNGKPTATTQIYSDSFTITSSGYTTLFSLGSKKSYLGTLNLQNWGDIPVAVMSGGLVVKDIGIGGHTESLLKVVERLCSKTGLMWI
ncbi:TPA: phage tail protein [Streptococcus suis]|nr:phage tail protein [Streptococcus suis]